MSRVKEELVDFKILLKALGEAYPNDKTAPGLVIAYIRTGHFYVSICRYTSSYGEGKYVVIGRKSESLVTAYNEVKKAWIEQMAPSKSNLDKLIGK